MNDELLDIRPVDAAVGVDVGEGTAGLPGVEKGLDVGAGGSAVVVEVADARDVAGPPEGDAASGATTTRTALVSIGDFIQSEQVVSEDRGGSSGLSA
ncbi:MAG: hypothetical protein JSR77_09815 [Planctomycetes bacterium]|nr:hypothetical protein [Planctomycetota bacterium]